MINIEKFVIEYKSHVEIWFHVRISKDDFKPEFEDFWSYVVQEIDRRDTLSKYNENHHSGAKFKTWMNIILERHFSDYRRKEKKYNWLGIDTCDKEEKKGIISEKKLDIIGSGVLESPSDLKYIIEIINKIPNDLHRIIVKLKLFYPGLIELSNEDFDFIKNKIGKTNTFIRELISTKMKHDYGLKDKDISELLVIKKGTINSTYQRTVRKYILEPYQKQKAIYS